MEQQWSEYRYETVDTFTTTTTTTTTNNNNNNHNTY
jgi:hypothetical protein